MMIQKILLRKCLRMMKIKELIGNLFGIIQQLKEQKLQRNLNQNQLKVQLLFNNKIQLLLIQLDILKVINISIMHINIAKKK